MDKYIIEYLMNRYNLENENDIRYIDDSNYASGAIECNGQMPNSIDTGWFFIGYEDDIKCEIEREKDSVLYQ